MLCIKTGGPAAQDRGEYLELSLPPLQEMTRFHYVWLRDHCMCDDCFVKDTEQRKLDTALIPADIAPSEVAVSSKDSSLTIVWKEPNEHRTVLSFDFLLKNRYSIDTPEIINPSYRRPKKTLWSGPELQKVPVSVQFNDLVDESSDKGRADAFQALSMYGVVFIDGTPPTPESSEKVASRLVGFCRSTHYGHYWDFTPNLEHADTAYTTIRLELHTDTTYFSEPAGLQMLHLIENKKTKGGKSMLADGFYAAERLRRLHPDSWSFLSSKVLRFRYDDQANRMRTETRIIGHNPSDDSYEFIRWNSDDRAPLNCLSFEDVPKFYKAVRDWVSVLRSPEVTAMFQLQPGRCMIFDNWRVLHGRDSFEAAGGVRRMCGCYMQRDDVLSLTRVLCADRPEMWRDAPAEQD
uniref:trimethyllysine dioxygenase n=1 Tax=Chromera velia CCMP2878 TaxID=1169474 RepID=A0A0G4HKZ0_9ALVE|mmetsp:Transcript_29212/g.57295  ORF Transcript_29212/g.57295 Transcript_29212/m.57295 type:complete len:406 (-) Transcript_29212:582-1799(-)|eukprot:Cvel_7300.t1-p1 / transcript=Cvel_7300.t1 / gene=Cvel_7300 / organism=Chromera_velia_CCMP2878 / gene_product=Trimethyllysine dioxygenase, mitochondrial, putative / transcript_product=Trimethyllysine dioxygenase, mitochondrial, putative / location=Cvel_scaffold377:81915-84789(+) / protein_length=405 / sequence_SO=supercontig / SO=protein_coding / is_pseudo=false